jgi:hypothetical protein
VKLLIVGARLENNFVDLLLQRVASKIRNCNGKKGRKRERSTLADPVRICLKIEIVRNLKTISRCQEE